MALYSTDTMLLRSSNVNARVTVALLRCMVMHSLHLYVGLTSNVLQC